MVHAQDAPTGSLRGTVVTEDSGQPIAGATVLLLGGVAPGTLTEQDGTYRLDSIPPGRHHLMVITDGAATEAEVTIVAGQTAQLDLVLTQSGSPGEVVLVTGTRLPERLLDAPVSADVISEQEMRRIGGSTFLTALSAASGFSYNEGGLIDQRVSARGFTALATDRILWLIDGRSAHNYLGGAGSNYAPIIDLDIKSMEAIVGPASALYGPNAQTGVLNIRTKNPWDESGASLSLRGGSQNLVDASVRVAGVVRERLGWKLVGQYLRAAEIPPDRESMAHYYGTSQFEADLLHDYNVYLAKMEGSLYYRTGDWLARAGYGISNFEALQLYEISRNHLGPGSWSWQFVELSHPNWHVHLARSNMDTPVYGLGTLARVTQQAADQAMSQPGLDTIDELREAVRSPVDGQNVEADLQARQRFAGLSAVLGLQWRLNHSSESFFFANPRGDVISTMEIGGYAQLDYRLLRDQLRLVGAMRLDKHSNFAMQMSPKAGVVYSPTKDHNLRLTYNRAFRTPNVGDLYFSYMGYILGNLDGFTVRDASGNVVADIPALEPETTNSVEFGYKGRIGQMVLLDFNLHNSWYGNFISAKVPVSNPDPTSESPTYGYTPDGVITAGPVEGTLVTSVNFGRALVRGLDANVSIYPNQHLNATVGASWLSLVSFDNSSAVAPDLLLNVPELQLQGAVTVENLGLDNYFVRLGGRYRTAYRFESGYWSAEKFLPDGRVPARVVVDLSAGYTFPQYGVSVQANIMNALGDSTIDMLGASPSRRLAFVQLRYNYSGLD